MNVIAFDPAKKTGWAFRDPSGGLSRDIRGIWRTGVCDPKKPLAVHAIIEAAKNAGCTAAALEDCYLSNAHGNVLTLKRLQESQTRIACICELNDLQVMMISPSTWQADYGLRGNREDIKIGAARIARMLTGRKLDTQDECDAVCIADYARRLLEAERR